jgi:hypothetical protein
MLPNLMPELDQLLSALFLVALLLYLIPAVFGLGSSTEGRQWFQRGAILTLGTAIAIAVVASVIWFTRWRLNIQLAHSIGLVLDRLNLARVIVSTARHTEYGFCAIVSARASNVDGASLAVIFHQPGMIPQRIGTSSGLVSANLTTSTVVVGRYCSGAASFEPSKAQPVRATCSFGWSIPTKR